MAWLKSIGAWIKAIGIAATLMLTGLSAWAAEPGGSDWATSESGKVRLVSAATATGESGQLRLGLHFKLEPGWKIYWRTPGDAGYPPKLDWTGSDNLDTPRPSWPAPHRFVLSGLQNYGYVGEVILPLDARAPDASRPVAARLAVEFLACSQICVPQKVDLRLDLSPGAGQPSAFAHDIGRFAALVPGDGRRHGLTLDSAEALGGGETSALRLAVSSTERFDAPDAFVEAEEVAAFGQPKVSLSSDRRRAVFEIPVSPGGLLKPLAGAPMTVTVTDGLRAFETPIQPVPGSAAPASAGGEAPGLAGMLLVALLGGLILNLMPCVLPVLSIKVLGVLGHGGGERGHVRASFVASGIGIVASFLALAGLAIGLKQAGAAVGWGIQFQQPGFLALMVVLLALFAANLWGLFEIPMPAFLFNRGGGVAHHTVLGHFLSGAFATLLATPCSAPFLGTAIGFALARGPSEIVAIFTALGLGMAAPYLAVAVWPDIALKLPRPGRWMVGVRKALGLALAGTGLWLLSVLMVQAGGLAALATGGAMAAAVVLLALRSRLPAAARSAVGACVVALAGLALAAPFHGTAGSDGGTGSGGAVAWERFDSQTLARLVSDGKVVFVDVTADWCITCKVNKAAVIERGEVASRLSAPGVVALRADWTKPDESISRYLASFGRYGIPFNAVYGPSAPDGIALPELLSEAEVLAALDKAR
ncbi:protein-disulfide reductase DsbD family protein [Paramagnetospirillum magneticum]|uniref:Thiol:disulfide interchange protein dsbD 1 n=1 Tax=Paramagnetospirillum magneticum (strain ATCC 700264 / AMB-1) TaxID=342108 RepID=Q2W1T9_PARM1|nr:protein-disulfide reductase DsbD domain-containing protein [Paramagnetospirillum magneticum]BAE52186.1 Thiol:disulfide interchange protein dsbD 1 precursor [Paramagnetospirillum magneticum AMB-1]